MTSRRSSGVIWCGEVLPTPVLAHWMRGVAHPSYTNLYGPTEATIASAYNTVAGVPADESAPIPIGRPCAGEDVVVLDEERRPVLDGEIGELWIAGAGLSPGPLARRREDGQGLHGAGDIGGSTARATSGAATRTVCCTSSGATV